jgi:hypothetical protein
MLSNAEGYMKDRNPILCPSRGADVKDIRPYAGKCLIRVQARLDPDLTE